MGFRLFHFEMSAVLSRSGALLLASTVACGSEAPEKPDGNSDAGEASGGSQVGSGAAGGSSGSGGSAMGAAGSAMMGDGGAGDGGAGDGGAALPGPTLVATEYGACGLDAAGQIHCWGAAPGEWQVPTGKFVELRSGDSWVCAIRADRSYACFPEPFGNPGMLDFAPPVAAQDLAVASGAICVIHDAGGMTCDRVDLGVADLTPPAGQSFKRVSVGSDFACGILASDASVVCWGDEGEAGADCIDLPAAGQLDAPAGVFVALDSSGYTTCGIDGAGAVECWGAGEATDDAQAMCGGALYNYGQGAPAGGQFRSVSVGFNHACGVKVDGTLACWGAGTTDECTLDVNVNCRQSRPPVGEFEHVAVGRTHSCAMTAERKVQCWGNNGTEPGGRTEPPPVFQ
jgi:hypothetical protein